MAGCSLDADGEFAGVVASLPVSTALRCFRSPLAVNHATPLQMQQAMFTTPAVGTPGLVFMLVNQLTLDGNRDVLFWNDSSQNGFDMAVEGVETPTFFSMSGACVQRGCQMAVCVVPLL